MLIAGEWRDASDGAEIDIFDPATEASLARVASATEKDAEDAVRAAALAGSAWAATAPRERAETLRRAFGLMTELADDLARLIVRENGKALTGARGEVLDQLPLSDLAAGLGHRAQDLIP